MARYIGARYVPIMGGAWDNSKEYEPLTIVQYEGDSYTSKMYVPAGIEITNSRYWVKTGNYNQQFAALQTIVQGQGEQFAALQTTVQGQGEQLQQMETNVNVARSALRNLNNYFIIRHVNVAVETTQPGAMASATGKTTLPENVSLIGVIGVETSGPFAINSYWASENPTTREVTGVAKAYNMGEHATAGAINLHLICYNKEGL